MVLEPTTFLVGGALEYALSLVRERAAAHAITLDAGGGSASRHVIEADELRFKQVVLNLVSNAVKFTPDGGTVSVRAALEGDELEVTVTDTGIGVPPRIASGSSSRSSRVAAGAPKEEGTGLGLTLSRRIVELFGGRMWLESVVGSGSTFGFAVPAPQQRALDADPAARRPGRAARRPARRRRPRLAGSDVGLPGRCAGAGGAGARRRRGARADPPGAAGGRRARHPAAAARRLAGARRPEGGPATWRRSRWSSRRWSTSGRAVWRWARTPTCSSRSAATTWSAPCGASGRWDRRRLVRTGRRSAS